MYDYIQAANIQAKHCCRLIKYRSEILLKGWTFFPIGQNEHEHMANPKRTYLFRAISLLLSILMVLSLTAVAVLADTQAQNETTSPTETTTPQQTTGSSPVTSAPETTAPVTTPAVTEPPFLVSASLEYSAYKKDYFVGDSFDPSGITVVLSYIGSQKRIPLSEYGNYSPKTLKATDTEVVVTFENGSSQGIPVSVNAKQLTNLSAKYDLGFKYHYYEGELLNLSGLSVTAGYNDGSYENLDLSKLTLSVNGGLSKKDTTVVASYGGKSFPITLQITPVKSISAEIVSGGTLVCGQYQIFDKSALKVTATYQDNHKAEVTNYDVLGDALNTPGTGKITVSYFGAAAQVSVSVLELTGIRVATKPLKTSYNEYDLPDITGMVVNGIYSNHPEAPITGYTVDTTTPLVPGVDGEAYIYVTFGSFSDMVTVNVSPITKLVIMTGPTKVKYYEGEAIDFTGITVKAVFKNGQSIENFAGFSIPQDSLYADSAKKPYVAYNQVTAEITTLNIVAIQGIGVVTKPNRLTYSTGEMFDPTGMEIVAIYPKENGQDVFKPIEIGACTFSIDRPLVPSDFDIVVTYKTFSAQPINIVVSDKIVPASMSAQSLPKTDYVSGQPLSLDGLVLVLGLSDGSVKVLSTSEYTTEPAAGTPVFGSDTKITVTYTGEEFEGTITLDIPISVSSKGVVSLLITPPSKTVYQEGEKFNENGMTVRAVYNDNSVEPITNYTIIGGGPFIIGSSSATTVPVTISAYGVESVVNVTVSPATISYIAVSTPPTKVVYQAGEKFDPAGMVVQVVYGNGKVLDVPADMYTFSPSTPFVGGENTVTVTFRGASAPLSITVEGGNPPTTGSDTTGPESGPSSSETNNPITNPVTDPAQTTGNGEKEGLPTGLTVLFISLVVFIVALVVVLIIYYRRHFC